MCLCVFYSHLGINEMQLTIHQMSIQRCVVHGGRNSVVCYSWRAVQRNVMFLSGYTTRCVVPGVAVQCGVLFRADCAVDELSVCTAGCYCLEEGVDRTSQDCW